MNDGKYSILLILSALSLTIGGFSLYAGKLVPLYLTYLTTVAVIVLVALSLLIVLYQNKNLKIIGVILAVISIGISLNPSHLSALYKFGNSFYISVADTTMITGFFLFPAIYIILFSMDYVRSGDRH